MDILLALSLRQHTFDHAKNFREHEGNWIPALIVFAFPVRLVILLLGYHSGIANWPSHSHFLETDLFVWSWVSHMRRDLAHQREGSKLGKGGSTSRQCSSQDIALQLQSQT